MNRKASAMWQGGLKDGKGAVSVDSGILRETPYTFATRFENAAGTNPEELIAAAHAGCFSMAFAAQLEKKGLKPREIRTSATLTLETGAAPTITAIHLNVMASVPGADRTEVQAAAEEAKSGCPVSKVLNAKITLETTFEA
jgi:lipoyl-dependent peroxiredoxin